LRVVSRTASFRYKGHSEDVRTICKELDATTVLEGTVSKVGDKLRVTARLINGANGFVQWSESYKRTMDDVFEVQGEITRRVVERFKLSVEELTLRSRRRVTDNPRALHAYLKGRFHWSRRYYGGLTAALECFQRAIAEDAGYVLAHTGLADAYSFLGLYSIQKPSIAFALASAEAERALSIDANVAEVQTSLALIAFGRDWNLPEAAQRFARAVELDRDNVLARIYHAWVLVLLDDVAGALALARTAQEIDPISPLVNSGAGYTLFLARQYEAAVAECQKSLEVEPNFIAALYMKGMCLACMGELNEAIEVLERCAVTANRGPFYIGLLGNFYARAGCVNEAKAILAELTERARTIYVPPHAFSYVYAGLGDLDAAFEWQAKAHDDGAAAFNYCSPVIDNMRGDPRHLAQMRAMGWLSWDTGSED
jgi:serine/threonine-protein kinase